MSGKKRTARAFLAGILGGIAMSVAMFIARQFGVRIRLELLFATVLGLPPSPEAKLIGYLAHLLLSGVIGLIYALGFEFVAAHHAGWEVGLRFSVLHLIISGTLIGFLPEVDPLFPVPLSPPGPFLINRGTTAMLAFIFSHFVYGAAAGAAYRSAVSSPYRVIHIQEGNQDLLRKRRVGGSR